MRELAASLGLVPNTIARAYRELIASGYAVGRGRNGTFVTDRLPERASGAHAQLAAAADSYVRRGRQLGFEPKAIRRAIDDSLPEP